MKISYFVIGAVVGLGLAGAAAAADSTLKASLSGAGGGSGAVSIKVSDAGQVCWDLTTKGLTDVTAAHIHKAVAGANGPPVVPFTAPDATGASKGCAAASAEVAKDLVANPAGYYVNVHTKSAPAGAVRGQLGK